MPMRIKKAFSIQNSIEFTQKAFVWAENASHFCYLNGNNCDYAYGPFPTLLATGHKREITIRGNTAIEDLGNVFRQQDCYFGFLAYEMSSETDSSEMGFFFSPETIIRFVNEETIEIETTQSPEAILNSILNVAPKKTTTKSDITFQSRMNKYEYVRTVEKLQQHLKRGDIYQINFCVDFKAKDAHIDPVLFYQQLNKQSPMPFSGLLKRGDRYIICASPERYLKKIGCKIVSQPMKGTAPRDFDPIVDLQNIHELGNSLKERAENTMIVDLVRNDLSRFCESGTVQVEKLCEIYSFYPVHQMVSTVVGNPESSVLPENMIRDTFPMGSMTGAPKIRAMELIKEYEVAPRGAFSGALGYIEPNGDFDFNVLIRSIFYDAKEQTLSYSVGSGITNLSDPSQEYEECMLKASSIQHVLCIYSENSFSN